GSIAVAAEPAGRDDWNSRVELLQRANRSWPVHERHHHIGHHHSDFSSVLGEQRDRFGAVGRDQYTVTVGLEGASGDLENRRFIIDHQYQFSVADWQFGIFGFIGLLLFGTHRGQVYF